MQRKCYARRMAQKVSVELIDDIDGTVATKTVRFSLDGASYAIDLSEKNLAALEKAMSKFVQAARKAPGGRGRARKSTPVSDYPVAEVRAWARAQGLQVPDRGRLKPELVEKWREANK